VASELPVEEQERLESSRILWVACLLADGSPHLTPVWFVFHQGELFISIHPDSVKAKAMRANPRVAAALEDGLHPIIFRGMADRVEASEHGDVVQAFQAKYDWDLSVESEYTQLVRLSSGRWTWW
jgi:F420H(2)-dependent biliverdin reductase